MDQFLMDAFNAGMMDGMEKQASFATWLGEAHGTEGARAELRKANYKNKGFLKGLLANVGDDYSHLGDALSGKTPIFTHTTERHQKTQKYLRKRLAEKNAMAKKKKKK